MLAYSRRSFAVLLFSSSLYLFAAFEVYLTFVSLLARAALPPFDWKNLVADSLPPTLKFRSWSHCHTMHVRIGCDPRCTTYRRGWSTEQRRCERLGSGGSKSSQDISRHRMVPMTMLGSSGRSQSISTIVRACCKEPGWCLYFVGLLRFEFLENLLGLCFCGTHIVCTEIQLGNGQGHPRAECLSNSTNHLRC